MLIVDTYLHLNLESLGMDVFKKKVNLLNQALVNLKSSGKFDPMEVHWNPKVNQERPVIYFQSLQLIHNIESDFQVLEESFH